MKNLSGKPMLEWVIKRGEQAKKIDETVVATTTDPSDDAVADWCEVNSVPCYRGSTYDVLDRYYQTALWRGTDRIVRVTADCPLIDPNVIDDVVSLYETTGADFAANRLPPPWHRTFPIGLDVEVVSFPLLERAWKEADKPFEREHVMPWFYTPKVVLRWRFWIMTRIAECIDGLPIRRMISNYYRKFSGGYPIRCMHPGRKCLNWLSDSPNWNR